MSETTIMAAVRKFREAATLHRSATTTVGRLEIEAAEARLAASKAEAVANQAREAMCKVILEKGGQ